MSIALEMKVQSLEARVLRLEAQQQEIRDLLRQANDNASIASAPPEYKANGSRPQKR